MNKPRQSKALLLQELQDAHRHIAELEARMQHLEKLLNGQSSSLPTPNTNFEDEIAHPVRETQLQTFSNIVEQASESIIVTDLNGRITYINPATEHLFGYRLEEVVGKEPLIFNADPDPATSHSRIVETVLSGEKFTQEVLHRRKDGSLFLAGINISPMRDKDGAIYGFIGLLQDITERKHAEKLAIAERDLSMALNNVTSLTDAVKICLDTAIGTSEIDSGGIYLRNETNGDFDLVVHKGLSDRFVSAALHYDKDSPGVRMMMEGNPVYFNYEKHDALQNKSAREEGLKAIAVLPVRYKNHILGCLNIGSHTMCDIPKLSRVALEIIASHIGAAIIHARQTEELRQSRKNYDLLFNSVQDFFIIIDSQGKIIHINDAVCKQLGYTREELEGQSALVIRPKELHEEITKSMQSVFAGHGNACTLPFQTKNGVLIPVESKATLGLWDGQMVIYCISRDITARLEFERALEESRDELTSVLDNSPIQIMKFDGERFLYASNSWYDFIGQEKTELPQIDLWASHIHPGDVAQVSATWQELWKTKRAGTIFFHLKNKSGDYRYFETRAIPVFDRADQFKHFLGYNIDITELKQAEERLRESQQRLDLAVRGAGVGLWDWLVQTGEIIINERWAEIVGYTLPELAPASFKKWSELCHPDDLKKSNELLEKHFAGETDSYECEVRLKHKNGEWIWILDRGKVFEWDDAGRPIRMAGTHLDITERKRAEEALKESEERFRTIFYTSPDAVVISTVEEGVFVDINHAVTRLTGYTREEIIGKTSAEINIWANLEERTKLVDKLKEAGYCENFEMVFRRKDGSTGTGLMSTSVMLLEGTPHMVSITRDITERKQEQIERERLMTAIEQAVEVVLITDAAGAIQYTNHAFERVTGYSISEAIGQNPRILKSGMHDKAFYTAMWKTIRSGKAWVGRIVNKRKSGKLYTETASISPMHDASGKIINYVAVKHDITRQLETEQQLIQAQKMESVGRLAGGVAHDFNNMLVAIIGYTELCRKKLPPDHAVRRWLDEIINASQRSADIIRQLLAFARKQAISPRALNLNETVANMLKLLQRLIGEGVRLTWQPGAELWPVKLDPSQVDQILANLCINARDAMSGVGRITIETGNAVIDAATCANFAGFVPGEYVVLTVSDNGCGMEKDVLDHIFEPFFTTKEVGKGTGLGLATVYGIIKQNRGFIYAQSEPGNGTAFRIYLPRLAGEAEAPMPVVTEEDTPKGNGEVVLIVEDEESVRDSVKEELEYLGYTTLSARTPSGAMQVLKEYGSKIDLLIADVILPEMNGRELANRVLPLCPNMKILFMSGYTADVPLSRDMMEESVHFLQKPFMMKDLAAKVRQVLDNR